MGTFLVAVVGALASGLVLVAVLGRYRETAWLADWEELLTPEGRQRYDELRERFERESAASQFTYARAREAAERGDHEAATRLLEAGGEFVATLAPDRDKLLEDLTRYTRMLGAVAPLPPLRPAQFQLREVSALAGAGWIAHHFLATVPERVRLRLGILRRSRRVVLRTLPSGLQRSSSGVSAADWSRVEAARSDWSTLDRMCLEHLLSFLAVTHSLSPTART
jgi:hypothetical protein